MNAGWSWLTEARLVGELHILKRAKGITYYEMEKDLSKIAVDRIQFRPS